MQARWYDPRTGQFLSLDPLRFAAGDSNLYRYVGNDPVNAVDPDGMDEISTAWLSDEVYWTPEGPFWSLVGPIGFQPNYESYAIGSLDGDYVDISAAFGGGRVLYADLIELSNGMTTATSRRLLHGSDTWQQGIGRAIAGLVASKTANRAAENSAIAFAAGALSQARDSIVGLWQTVRHPVQTAESAYAFLARPYPEVERDLQRGFSQLDVMIDTPRGRGQLAMESFGAFVPLDEVRYLKYLDGVSGVSAVLRSLPGVVTGGALRRIRASEAWFLGTHGSFAKVPGQVADALRGRRFNSFDEFRSEFWETVANDPDLAVHFKNSNLTRMKGGLAPIAESSQHYGDLRSYVLHHKTPIHTGGGVYDLDNLLIVSPKFHQSILDPAYHFGR